MTNEIIKCKDCAYLRYDDHYDDYYCQHPCATCDDWYCGAYLRLYDLEGFCSWAKLKTESKED